MGFLPLLSNTYMCKLKYSVVISCVISAVSSLVLLVLLFVTAFHVFHARDWAINRPPPLNPPTIVGGVPCTRTRGRMHVMSI